MAMKSTLSDEDEMSVAPGYFFGALLVVRRKASLLCGRW